jgi:hypothetical protein
LRSLARSNPALGLVDSRSCVSFQKLDVYQRAIEFLPPTRCPEVGGTIDEQQYARGIELLERVVAMLSKLIYP